MVDIKLKVKFTEDQDLANNKWTLLAQVVEYVNIPRAVFVFERTLDLIDVFQTVATPVRIEKFPATEPDHPGGFFRQHEVFLEFDQLEDREESRDIFEARLRQLVEDWHIIYPDVASEDEVEFTATDT